MATNEEVKALINEFATEDPMFAEDAAIWEVTGFNPSLIIKEMMRITKDAAQLKKDIMDLCRIMINFSNIHVANSKRRMGADALKRFNELRVTYDIKLRAKKGDVVVLTNSTITLPRIQACFPFVTAGLLNSNKMKIIDVSQYCHPSAAEIPNGLRFTGAAALLSLPHQNTEALKLAAIAACDALTWCIIGFSIGYDRLIKPKMRTETPDKNIVEYVKMAANYQLGSPEKNMEMLIRMGALTAEFYVKASVLTLANYAKEQFGQAALVVTVFA